MQVSNFGLVLTSKKGGGSTYMRINLYTSIYGMNIEDSVISIILSSEANGISHGEGGGTGGESTLGLVLCKS